MFLTHCIEGIEMYEIILIRHGQSEWNKQGLFTGWTDVALSEQGRQEAIAAGEALKNYPLTLAYTSLLKRAIGTLWLALKHADQMNIPVIKDWHLNERHYGSLQGKNKEEMRKVHGKEQVHIWRRSFDTKPPQSDKLAAPAVYKGLENYPCGESLSDTCERVIPYWENEISQKVKSGEKIIIAAHGNSLRALIMHIEKISKDEIVKLEIPTGKLIKVTFDKEFNFMNRSYIEDQS